MEMQTAIRIAALAGIITAAIMVMLGQFVTPEGAPEALAEELPGGETGGK